MSTSLVVVAVPTEDDRVWKVSSEKVPHLTLLYLGDDSSKVANVDSIVQFVEHAANTMLRRFYLPVDRRGELGEDKADVLFFKQNRYDVKAVREFRSFLLKDANVKTAYDAAPQFDGPWLPHLTLGYPETPAKKNDDDHQIWDVSFDRIQVWFGNYEGPEFRLRDSWDDIDEVLNAVPMDVSMSDISGVELQHYGVKGMKWGVRNTKTVGGSVGRGAKTVGRGVKAVAKDVYFESSLAQDTARNRVAHRAGKSWAEKDVPKLDAEYRGTKAGTVKGRLKNPLDPKTIEYRSRARAAFRDRLNEEVAKLPTNQAGNRRYEIEDNGNTNANYFWEVKVVDVKKQSGLNHADSDELMDLPEFVVRPTFDQDGFIIGFKQIPDEDALEQTMDLGVEFLSHYGVKGMKWGVRKENETRKAWLDPEGHDKVNDIARAVIWPMFPPLGIFAVPSQIRLARAAGRGIKAKTIDVNEKNFAKKAQSAKNFAEISNRAKERIDRELPSVNARHPGDLTKNPKKQKAYDDDVKEILQTAYREAARSVGNKPNTMHLDVEFENDGFDFKIKAREGTATPLPKRVRHAVEDETEFTLEFTGKLQRASTGHIRGLKFDPIEEVIRNSFGLDPEYLDVVFEENAIAQTLDLGAEFLSHYGVRGMKWGVRKERTAVNPVATSVRRGEAGYRTSTLKPSMPSAKTKIKTEGGENHPAHDDALKVARAQAKLKKSGPAALSNQELRELQERMNLERNVIQLAAGKGRIGRGRQFVRDITGLGNEANSLVDVGNRTAANVQKTKKQVNS